MDEWVCKLIFYTVIIMYKFLLLLLIANIGSSFALGLSDFAPNFLKNMNTTKESSDKTLKIHKNNKPIVKFNCNTNQSGTLNIFCGNSESFAVFSDSSLSDNDPTTANDANAISKSRNFAIPDANQSSFRTTQSDVVQKTPQEALFHSLSVPIQTSKNLNFNISPQQIELNIKY